MAIQDFKLEELKQKHLQIGDLFPNFELYANDFEKHALNSFKTKGKVILIFPSLKTSVCDLQLSQLVESLKPKLENDQLSLLAISYDSPLIGAEWCQLKAAKNMYTLSLVSTGKEFVKKLGIYLPECEFLAYRSVFVIDNENKVKYVQYAKSLKSNLDLADLLKNI